MQTKEFATQTGLSAATLRYYEQEGLEKTMFADKQAV